MIERPAHVEFFFDVMCPYAYQSSKWIRSVRDGTGLEVRWRFFSLEEINRVEGKKHPWERDWSYGWSQMRVAARLRQGDDGDGAVDRWYEAVGRAFHEAGRTTHVPDVHREVLAEAGFDPDVLDDALADPTTHDDIRRDHEHVVQVHGAFGVPTIVFPDGRAVYQQIVPAPTEVDRAVELFDLVVAFNRFPEMSELRHPKTATDMARIAEVFEPYLRARAWRTIENPAP
jgi:2-hydroxychromene-2-carboxylate isomerase